MCSASQINQGRRLMRLSITCQITSKLPERDGEEAGQARQDQTRQVLTLLRSLPRRAGRGTCVAVGDVVAVQVDYLLTLAACSRQQ